MYLLIIMKYVRACLTLIYGSVYEWIKRTKVDLRKTPGELHIRLLSGLELLHADPENSNPTFQDQPCPER